MEFIRKIQKKNTVRATGATNLRDSALHDALGLVGNHFDEISIAAWKRPGTPEVALLAP